MQFCDAKLNSTNSAILMHLIDGSNEIDNALHVHSVNQLYYLRIEEERLLSIAPNIGWMTDWLNLFHFIGNLFSFFIVSSLRLIEMLHPALRNDGNKKWRDNKDIMTEYANISIIQIEICIVGSTRRMVIMEKNNIDRLTDANWNTLIICRLTI